MAEGRVGGEVVVEERAKEGKEREREREWREERPMRWDDAK
jgi:hypothetical protein